MFTKDTTEEKSRKDTTEEKSRKDTTEEMFTKDELRTKKLWKYTQKVYESKDSGTTGTGTKEGNTETSPQFNTVQ